MSSESSSCALGSYPRQQLTVLRTRPSLTCWPVGSLTTDAKLTREFLWEGRGKATPEPRDCREEGSRGCWENTPTSFLKWASYGLLATKMENGAWEVGRR